MIQEAIQKLVDRKDLVIDEAEAVMQEIMSGSATDAQIAGFLVGLRMKGETIDEITALAKVMREKANSISPKISPLVDTCGTGGDKKGTFNISTAAAFIVAGAGIAVAKHGNKSVSSKCGSADVLSELGINLDLTPKQVEKCIEKIGIGFLFAPKFHEAMKYAVNARKQLGIRTVFNILGPLTNPANASSQIVGVFDEKLTKPLAEVLGKLGSKHAMVVYGNGLDEITLDGETTVSEYKKNNVITYKIKPTDFGIKLSTIEEIKGSSPKENAQIILNILSGKERGAKRNIAVLNAAAAIYASDKVGSIKDGIALAEKAIDSGSAMRKMERLREYSNKI